MKNKKTLIVLFAFLALVGLIAGLWFGLQEKPAEEPKATGVSFTVTVVHADKTEKAFSYTTKEASLGRALEAEGLIESQGADPGMFHTVDGERADWNENQSYWAFYIGEDYAMTGIYDTPVSDGGVYKLEYTIG